MKNVVRSFVFLLIASSAMLAFAVARPDIQQPASFLLSGAFPQPEVSSITRRTGFHRLASLLTPSSTLTVTKTDDTNDGVCDADCSLREAVAAAAPGDEIVFASPLFDTAQTVDLNGQIVIDKAVTIAGRGSELTNIRNIAAPNATSRVFVVTGNPVTLSRMTVSGGRVDRVDLASCGATEICGAGIQNNGNLTLNEMLFTDNRVTGTVVNGLRVGGAVGSAQGSVLTILNSTFTDNSVSGPGQNFGGAIYSAGTLVIANSTITGNSLTLTGAGSLFGGGLVREGGTATIFNTTISNNVLTGSSGGDFCEGGGVFQSFNFAGDVRALNVIVANNSISNCQASGPDFAGTLNSLGNNLIRDPSGANIIGTTTGNILNQNPELGPLGYFGGTVPTRPISNGSPANSAGNSCVTDLSCPVNPPIALTADQRGAARFGAADIGAYEVNIALAGGNFRFALPNARRDVAYTRTLIDDTESFATAFIGGGGLPSGVTLQSTGAERFIAGTPTVSGPFAFSLNLNSPTTGTVTIDYSLFVDNELVPPDTTITANPAALSNNPNPSFSFVGTDNTTLPANMTFECSLDSAPFTACTSPQTYSGVADGPHLFAVRAKDEAGNLDPTPATYLWTIETVPPAAPVISAPADQSIVFVSQPTVSGTAEPNSTVTIYIDNVQAGTTLADGAGNWSRVVSFPVADGFRTVKATATDAAGNISPESSNNFRIATIPPTIGAFANQTISVSGNAVYSPAVASTGAQYAIATTSSKFTGKLVVDPLNGDVRVTNAGPAGVYDVAVKVVNPFGSQTANFTLTVQTTAGCTTFDSTAFAPRTIHAAGPNAIGLAIGDFNGDGRQDIVTANQDSNTLRVLIRNAANTDFEAPVTLNADLQPTNLAVADFNGDGKQDIASANFLGQSVSVFLRNLQNTGFEAPMNVPMNSFPAPGRQPYDIAAGDLNGDSLPDLVTANYNGSGISVGYRNAANTDFEAFVEYGTESLARSVRIADFNGDGRNDIVVLAQLGTASVFLRNSTNTDFEPRVVIANGNSPTDLTVGDFNGDGRPDVAFVSNSDALLSVVLRNSSNNGFDPVVTYPSGGLSRSVATGDFNHDGREDIVVSAEGSVNVFLRSAANDGFLPFVGFNAGGLPWASEIGDFNGDNRQDIAAVNFPDTTVSVLARQCPVDNVPPDTTILTTPGNPSNSSSAAFTFTGSDNQTPPGSLAFECSLDNASFATCASPQNFSGLTDGNHTFAVRAIDQAGNTDPTAATYFWSIDSTAPTVQLTSAAPNPANATFSVTATFSENVNGFDLSDVSVANGSAGNFAGSGSVYAFDVTPASPGTVSVSVPADSAQDAAGNGNQTSNQLTRQFNDQAVLIVNKTVDTNDGVCSTADCSLREAIAAGTSGTTISFGPLFGSPQTIALTHGELLIDKNLSIVGTGANLLTVSGNNANRVFRVINTTASINSLTVTGGNADNGGGIFSFGSQLTITNSVIAGNTASANAGGIYNIDGTLELSTSTVSGNTAGDAGGGITNGGAPAVLNVINSTISGNTALNGGGIFTNGQVTVRSSTITRNVASINGGGIANFTGEAVSLGNTIVAGNTAPVAPDFRDTLTSLGFNLIGNTVGTTITGDATGNILNQNALLSSLLNNGGTTPTHALLPNSPAINAGTSTNAPATDQRGRPRVGQVDIGAYEFPPTLIVTKTADTNDGICDADCSLREAVTAAASGDLILFASPLFDTPQTVQTNGQIIIDKIVTIAGRGANLTTVQNVAPQSSTSRVFFIDPTGNLTLTNVTVTGGNLPGNNTGGGILNRNVLTLIDCQISGNFIAGVGSGGGVGAGLIFTGDVPTTLILNSTISGNQSQVGGGIHNRAGNATVINSTVSGNQATSGGGGIFNNGTINIVNSTITANSSTIGGGISMEAGTLTLRNSIVAQNTGTTGRPDIARLSTATLTSNGNNLIGNSTDTNSPITWQPSDVLDQTPLLAPLGFYGGATQTHALLGASPAINAGNNCVLNQNCPVNNSPVPLPADQRDAARVGNVDIGAFEANSSANGGTFRGSLPDGTVNLPYSFTLVPNNGSTTYAVTDGTLPNGMSLTTNFAPNAVVALVGTPSNSGVYDFTVTATDGGNTVVTDYRLNVLAPTAAGVSVSGRVRLADGRGLANAIVTLTDANGVSITVRTGSFGLFRFAGVASGQTVVVNVKSRRFAFAPQVVFVGDEVTGLEIVGAEF